MLVCLGAMPLRGVAAVRELRVIASPEVASQRQILQSLKSRFAGVIVAPDAASLESRGTGPVLAIGPAALKLALAADLKGPVVAILTSSQTYRRLLDSAPSVRQGVTGIHADASPLAQLQLVAALFERRVTAGVLLSEASAYLERPLRAAAMQAGVELQLERVDASSNVVRSLNRLSNAQVLLAVPDSTLYTPDTLRSVLESTYRRGLPVIGFSSATVAAGTLATAYADINDVVADAVELLESLGSPGVGVASLPEARFPRFWRVGVNHHVARSLGIAITDKVLTLGAAPPPGRPA